MKRIGLLIGLSFLLSSFAHAATLGPYLGASMGKSSARTPDQNAFVVSSSPAGSNTLTRNGWAERAFLGYNITPYFGLEIGYTNYARAVYNGRVPGAHSEFQYNFRSEDAVGKVYFPLGYTGYNIYALAGVARVTAVLNYTNGGLPLTGAIAAPTGTTTNAYNTRPLYGVGVNFSYPKYHFTISLEVTQIDRVGNFDSNPVAIPYLNFANLGFAYNFC